MKSFFFSKDFLLNIFEIFGERIKGIFEYFKEANSPDEYIKFKILVVPDLGRPVIKICEWLINFFFKNNFSISNNDLLINF